MGANDTRRGYDDKRHRGGRGTITETDRNKEKRGGSGGTRQSLCLWEQEEGRAGLWENW